MREADFKGAIRATKKGRFVYRVGQQGVVNFAHPVIELIQRFERIARMMILTIGWGDLQPKDIARLGSALMKIQTLTETHLESIPKEFLP